MQIEQLSLAIQNEYSSLHNWRAVAAARGITGGLAYRIATEGYEPKEPHLRLRLGLPALAPAPVCERCGDVHVTGFCTVGLVGLAPAPVCPDCGQVHVTGFCTQGAEIAPAPVCPKCGKVHLTMRCLNGSGRKRKPRLSISKDDPARAARSIARHMDADAIAALVDALVTGRNEHVADEPIEMP